MQFRILGPLEILDGERVLPLGGPKRRAVVAALLLNPNRVVASDQLIDLVWGEVPPAAALGSLQNHVLRLRRELGDRLVTRPPGYLLRVEPGELDLDRFRTLVEEARASEPSEASSLLREALALWRGDPLADLTGEPVGTAAAPLAELRREALENRIDADFALGRHATLVPDLEALVAEQPFRERLRGQLMLALYRSGRQADALEAYGAARTALIEELGMEPGSQLQDLQRAILRQDADIAGPAAAVPEAPDARMEEARKTVTLVLADLSADSGPDPEVRRDQLRRRREEAVATLVAHGAEAGRTVDTRVLGIFGVPVAREDDALRAVRAAHALVTGGLVVRAGVATGDVITGDQALGRPLVSGPPLEEADRLCAAAGRTDVLVGERAWRLVRHAVTAERRDGDHVVRSVLEDAEPVARRLETPLVGREDELAEIVASFGRATRERKPHLVTVFGSPGVGKTRLAHEVVDQLSGAATCMVGRTPAYGEASTYAPLRDAFSTLAGGSVASWAAGVLAGERDGELVAARIAAAAGEAASTGPVEETAWAARRLLETLARERPVVLVLEDLHWSAPAFLDLVEHVAELARAPILLLGLARPELLDTRPQWAGGRLSASSILLDALAPDQARVLLDGLAADNAVDDEKRTAILAGAAGNPLFLEQLLASALDGETSVPDSIHALLSARLDRLPEAERHVAQAAAAYGQTFPTEVVQSLVDVDVRPALVTLARRDFVEPEAPDVFGEEAWGFRHALVRDEAYASIPKRRRAALHRQIAAIVTDRAGRWGVEADELIGYHLESAYRAQVEVDPQAPELAGVAVDAARHLTAAGRRSYDGRDPATTAGLLRRAAALLPAGAPERLELAPALADALGWNGERDAASRVVDEAAAAAPPGDERTHARLEVARLNLALWGPKVDAERMFEDLRKAIAVLEAVGDDEALAYAHIVTHHVSYRRSARTGATPFDAEEQLELAAKHARAAGSHFIEGVATSWLCVLLRRGWQPVEEARRRIQTILEDPPDRYTRASALGGLGTLCAMEGAFDEGRALMTESHALIEDLGLRQTAAADSIALADVEIMAGDLDRAERFLRGGLAELEAVGDQFSAANAAWRLALVLTRRGEDSEAERYLERAGELETGQWIEVWRLLLGATLAARRGRSENAEELLRESEPLMRRLFESGMHADALIQAAEASELIGRTADAVDRLRRASAIARRLGYVVAERTANERLAAIKPS
ncbi:MAG TPA: BTAD domain-containing putative transcriptional regulator [Gaiellaceae bacterium]|nr:BTAD domain-containing putative transcriptional regulator [Gaiellaceae bacterium]